MIAQEKFNHLISKIHPLLKQKGYLKQGNLFRKQLGNNWGVINFLKFPYNTQQEVRFAIDIGTYSHAVDEYVGWQKLPRKPHDPDCHWRRRMAGNVFDTHSDKGWWDVDTPKSVEMLVEQVKNCLFNEALPEIDQHLTDEQLKACWLADEPWGGISEFMRLRYLSILLMRSGEKEQMEQVLHQIERDYIEKEKPCAGVATRHVQKMREEIKLSKEIQASSPITAQATSKQKTKKTKREETTEEAEPASKQAKTKFFSDSIKNEASSSETHKSRP